LKDKFGDQGIVGVMLAIPDSTESGTLVVDSFLISCRALGRGVEEVLWAELTPRGSEKKFTRLKAEYIPTAKNGVVAGIFDRLGMTCTEDGTAGKKYLLEQLRAVTSPRWITVEY
jgi:predicted enzyme involved in methoxymalonyl-ACP biosynthesis